MKWTRQCVCFIKRKALKYHCQFDIFLQKVFLFWEGNQKVILDAASLMYHSSERWDQVYLMKIRINPGRILNLTIAAIWILLVVAIVEFRSTDLLKPVFNWILYKMGSEKFIRIKQIWNKLLHYIYISKNGLTLALLNCSLTDGTNMVEVCWRQWLQPHGTCSAPYVVAFTSLNLCATT